MLPFIIHWKILYTNLVGFPLEYHKLHSSRLFILSMFVDQLGCLLHEQTSDHNCFVNNLPLYGCTTSLPHLEVIVKVSHTIYVHHQ